MVWLALCFLGVFQLAQTSCLATFSISAAIRSQLSPLPMVLVPGEAEAYNLIPFVRSWAQSSERWTEIVEAYKTLDAMCKMVATPENWVALAILCSLFTRSWFTQDAETGTTASMWYERKPYPSTVASAVSEMTLDDAAALQRGFEDIISMLHDWAWMQSDLLTEDDRITLRTLKVSVLPVGSCCRAGQAPSV